MGDHGHAFPNLSIVGYKQPAIPSRERGMEALISQE